MKEKEKSSWKTNLLLIALWINFLALWFRVYQITTSGDVEDSFTHLGSLLSVYGVAVTLWVIHNIRIYRKKGPRRSVRVVHFAPIHDSLNQYISRQTDLQRDQEIVVDIVSGRKVFIEGSTSAEEALLTLGSR